MYGSEKLPEINLSNLRNSPEDEGDIVSQDPKKDQVQRYHKDKLQGILEPKKLQYEWSLEGKL